MHEDFSRKEEVEGSSDRSFGFVMGAFFAIIAILPLLRWSFELHWWALAVSLVFVVLAQFWTAPLAPLNYLWLKLGLLLFHIISPIVLGLLFYLTVAPIGLLMRLFGKDPLRLRRNSDAKSYWIVREPPGPPPETMKNQF